MRAVPRRGIPVARAPVTLIGRIGVPAIAVAGVSSVRDEVEPGHGRSREIRVLGRARVDDADDDIRRTLRQPPDVSRAGAVVAGSPAVPHVPLLAEERVVGDERGRGIHAPVGLHGEDVGSRLERRCDRRGFGEGEGLGEVDDPECRGDHAVAADVGAGALHGGLERAGAHQARSLAHDEPEHLGRLRAARADRPIVRPARARRARRTADPETEDERSAQAQDSSGSPHA